MIGLDTNVVMEVLQRRRRFEAVSMFLTYQAGDESLAVSTLTASHLFYLMGSGKVAAQAVEKQLAHLELFNVLPTDVAWALKHYKRDDFEDALQVAAAIREGCSMFVTLDTKLAKKYKKHLNIALIQ